MDLPPKERDMVLLNTLVQCKTVVSMLPVAKTITHTSPNASKKYEKALEEFKVKWGASIYNLEPWVMNNKRVNAFIQYKGKRHKLMDIAKEIHKLRENIVNICINMEEEALNF